MSRNTIINYLKAIYAEEVSTGTVSTGGLARRLGVRPPTASAMLKRIENEGLIRRSGRGEVELTGRGRQEAARVVRKHRLVETFLHEVLGYSLEELHTEAVALEAAISDTLEERLDAYLGHPDRDPHGHPIPQRSGRRGGGSEEPPGGWTERRPARLSAVGEGSVVRVAQVDDDDSEAVRHLANLGVLPDVELRVGTVEPFGGPIWLETKGRRMPLARGLADRVFVEPLAGRGEGGRRRARRARS